MISAPKNCNAHLASTWTMATALTVLGVGLYGASQPLLPVPEAMVMELNPGVSVVIEEFNPSSTAAPVEKTITLKTEFLEDVEIPPLPTIEKLIDPPEMAELTPVEFVRETPSLPKVNPHDAAQSSHLKKAVKGQEASSENRGSPNLFTGGGGSGRFPSPSYPSSARRSGLQGLVRLLVIVEASGIPSSVDVQSSSGCSSLDSAASDHVRRRWRWPSGSARCYIVPIRFVLQ